MNDRHSRFSSGFQGSTAKELTELLVKSFLLAGGRR
jgi:hypothetical protein